MSSKKYLLTIAYDGTDYGGWQVQHNAPSIQSSIENALRTILQEPITLAGSGRTDAGVHALGQTAHFTTFNYLNPIKTLASLSRLLPPSIRILNLTEVPSEFHARYSAIGKIYHYHLFLGTIRSPFKHRFTYRPYHPIDLNQLKRAAAQFIGTHDFTSFAHQAHTGSAAHDPIRTLNRLDVIEEEEGARLEFEGNGFLYKMVRNITGTLLDICAGKIEETQIEKIFLAKNRQLAGKTAPAQGLFLVKVLYP